MSRGPATYDALSSMSRYVLAFHSRVHLIAEGCHRHADAALPRKMHHQYSERARTPQLIEGLTGRALVQKKGGRRQDLNSAKGIQHEQVGIT